MLDSGIKSRRAREKWYDLCKDLYDTCKGQKFIKCKMIMQKEMPDFWKKFNKNPKH
jgi:hypothetical protein